MKDKKSLKQTLEDLRSTAKERTVKTQSFDVDLETLIKKIKKNIYKLDPDYQRRRRWTQENSSKLIESLLLNIPVPTIYISLDIDPDSPEADYSTEDARYTVIDGQQRLSAIYGFLTGDYSLKGLEVLNSLNGFNYVDLPPFLKRRLEDRSIRCLQVDSTIDSQVKYDIFERLNTGSVKLEAQELRNCIYRGEFNDFLKEISSNEVYLKLINMDIKNLEKSKRYQKMEDVELALRFYAMQDYEEFKSEFKDFLDTKQNFYNKNFDSKKAKKMKDDFENVINYLNSNFEDKPFSKWKFENGKFTRSSSFNAAVFDAITAGIILSKNKTQKKVNYVEIKNLFKDEEFFNSVDVSTNRPKSIEYRITKVKEIFDQ